MRDGVGHAIGAQVLLELQQESEVPLNSLRTLALRLAGESETLDEICKG